MADMPFSNTDRACSVGPLGRVKDAGYGSPGILLGALQSAAGNLESPGGTMEDVPSREEAV